MYHDMGLSYMQSARILTELGRTLVHLCTFVDVLVSSLSAAKTTSTRAQSALFRLFVPMRPLRVVNIISYTVMFYVGGSQPAPYSSTSFVSRNDI